MFELLPILAADGGAGYAVMGATLGAGIATLGVALGLGKIAAGFAEGVARQPEAAGRIQGPSLLMAFLAEGVALFACVICFLAAQTGGAALSDHADNTVKKPGTEQASTQK